MCIRDRKYDVGIIGSGPAGLSAAIYAKRANLSAVVIEKEYEGTGQIAESGPVSYTHLDVYKRQRDIQKRCEHQAHRKGMRVSRVCAWNTSRLAYDRCV